MWYPPATEVKAFPTAALSTSGYGSKVIPSSQPVKTSSPAFFVVKIKQEQPSAVAPVKNPCMMTSYGGSIRIRLRVEVG